MAENRFDWRPSRDERAPYISALNEALADERLGADEHEDRVARAEAATSFATLDGLVADLPFEWHDPTVDRAQKTDRRRFILGAAGLVGIAAASWAGTRTWVTSRDDAAASDHTKSDGGTKSPGDGAADADGKSVPTDLVQVENWQKDTVPSAIRHATALGLVMIARLEGSGDTVRVSGSNRKDQWMDVTFEKNIRPVVEINKDESPSDKWLKPDEIPDIDIAALHNEVKSQLSKNTAAHDLDISYDITREEWLITISDGSARFSWTLDGLDRV